MESQWKWW